MTHNILIITGGQIPYHKYPESAKVLAEALRSTGMTVTTTQDAIAAKDLAACNALVLFTDGDYFDDVELESIIGFVEGGKGLISIHTAAGTNKAHVGFGKLIGSRISGGVIEAHDVIVENDTHAITKDVKPFRLDDEIHDLEPQTDYQTLLSALMKGKKQPLAYVKSAGKGKVVHFATGHSLAGLTQPDWQKIFVRAVEFVCGI